MVYLSKTYVDYNEVKVLLNENKVKMMTKMAIYEKNEGRRMLKTAKYFKGDYVAFGILKTLDKIGNKNARNQMSKVRRSFSS